MSYFKPLRRKLGVVALLVACVFAVGWARSLKRDEVLNLNAHRSNFAIRSFDGRIQFRRFGPNDAREFVSWNSMPPPKERWMLAEYIVDDWRHFNLTWRNDFFSSFHIGTGTHKRMSSRHLDLCTLPYWSIVIPLTLLSAWLLLSKPRPTTAKAPV